MLSITSKGNYGISAILELADNYGRGLMQIKDITARRGIPKHYLVQILNRLLKFGIVKSVRGNKGGYELADDPANISFLQVLELLEGKVDLAKNYPKNDAIKELYIRAEAEMKKKLDITLDKMLLMDKEYKTETMYYI